jgi:hypothetical protein
MMALAAVWCNVSEGPRMEAISLLGLDSMPLGRGEAEGRTTEASPRTTSETKLSEWLLGLDSNQQPSG